MYTDTIELYQTYNTSITSIMTAKDKDFDKFYILVSDVSGQIMIFKGKNSDIISYDLMETV